MMSSPSRESESTEAKSKARGSCTYRVLYPLCLVDTGQWFPAGAIVDLSDLEDARIQHMLRARYIETADPTAEQPVFNEPLGNVVKRTPCPCGRS
jgi:hypothetical protein